MPSLDVIIFVWFLTVYLIAGFIWRPKHNIIDYYSKLNGKFPTAKIVAAYISGWIGGGLMFIFLVETLNNGLYFVLTNIASPIMLIITGTYIAPRMSEFIGKSSIAESTNELWGSKVAFITSICYILLTFGILTIQIQFFSKNLECFGIQSTTALIISWIIITFYCITASSKTATFSDIIQFISFSCYIPIIFFIIWQALNNTQIMWEVVKTRPNFDLTHIFNSNNHETYRMLGVLGLVMIPKFGPLMFQNISMSQNTKQSALSFKISGLIILSLQISTLALGLLIISHNPNYTPINLMSFFFIHFTNPPLKLIIAMGTIMMIMSSASFFIYTSANMLIKNILQPIGFKKIYNQRLILKYFVVTISSMSTYFILKLGCISNLLLFCYAIYTVLVSTPFLLAIFGFRSAELSVLIGMCASVISMIVYQWKFAIPAIDFFIPGILANIIFLFGSHYILKQKGGWLGIKGKCEFDEFKQEKRQQRKQFLRDIFGMSFIDFCKQGLPNSSANISFFGLFSLISIFLTQITLNESVTLKHITLTNFIYASAFITAANLVFYPIWPQPLKKTKFVSITWILSILYISIIIPIIFALISNFAQMQMMIALINIIAIFVMLKWNISLFLIFSGSFIASIYLYYASINIEQTQIQITYLLLFLTGALISFLKPYKDRNKKLELISKVANQLQNISEQTLNLLVVKQGILNNLSQEIKTPITNIGTGAISLHQNKNNLEKHNRDSTELIYREYKNLQRYVDQLTNLSKFGTRGLILNYQDINFEELVENAIDECFNCKSHNPNTHFKSNTKATQLIITCDPSKISQSLRYLVKNAVKFTKKGTIEVLLENQDMVIHETMTHMIKCSIIDEGIGIPEDELEYIFRAFTKSSYTKNSGKGLELALCHRIITLHNGMIWAENNNTKPGATFTFMIPIRPISS